MTVRFGVAFSAIRRLAFDIDATGPSSHLAHAMKILASVLLSVLAAGALGAQVKPNPTPPDTVAKLEGVKVNAQRVVEEARVSAIQTLTLPVTASITAQRVEETVNLVDAEDAVKYLPSVFLRKRNNGDTQATMATRVWGMSSSARSLIFADGVPLTALIANNNTIGGPRWGLVSPAEIARIDMMYGPVLRGVRRQLDGRGHGDHDAPARRLEGSISQTQALQTFELYGTKNTYGTTQTTADVGNRFGKFSFWASGNYQNSHSQPLALRHERDVPDGHHRRLRRPEQARRPGRTCSARTGLLHTGMTNAKIKAAYDITPMMRAAYTFGYWKNDADANVDTYIDKSGQPTFAGQAGFASGFYHLLEEHSSHSLSLRTDTKARLGLRGDRHAVSLRHGQQRTPTTASATDTTLRDRRPRRGARRHGLVHARPQGHVAPRRRVECRAHAEVRRARRRYTLNNPTYNTPDWRAGDVTTVATEGDGKTRTQALWAQDGWCITPALKLTVGGRYENWRGFDGFNVNGTTTVMQPTVTGSKFSPKAVLAWTPTPSGRSRRRSARRIGSRRRRSCISSSPRARRSRRPIRISSRTTCSRPSFASSRTFARGSAQLSLFQDDVHDAIISQFLPLVPNSTTLYSYVSNVDHVRARGAEVVLGSNDVFVHGLELSGTATYVDAKTLAMSGRASATAPAGSAIGKLLPNIPKWRASFASTYRPSDRLALTLAGRYSSKLYTTLDNADVNSNTYQGFSEWFVVDARVNYRVNRHWSASAGVDNLLNRKYFLFHPFPQRTFVGTLKYGF